MVRTVADYVFTPDQVALLADGRAGVEIVDDGVALVLGPDRLILPTTDLTVLIDAIVQTEYLLGATFATATSRRTRGVRSDAGGRHPRGQR